MSVVSKSAIVLVAKKYDEKLVKFLSNEFKNNNIYLITPEPEKIKIKSIVVLSDQTFLDFESFSKKLKGTSLRVGWYYQQFLKLHVCLQLEYDNIYIIDGDSVVKNEALKYDSISTTGKLAEKKYIEFNKAILDINYKEELSYVTNEMVFNKNVLRKLIEKIEIKFSKFWVDAILDILKSDENVQFSEYQLYGSYAVNNMSYSVRRIKVFRRMDCIHDSIANGLKKYDLLAYENHHKTGFLRYIRAKFLYFLSKELG